MSCAAAAAAAAAEGTGVVMPAIDGAALGVESSSTPLPTAMWIDDAQGTIQFYFDRAGAKDRRGTLYVGTRLARNLHRQALRTRKKANKRPAKTAASEPPPAPRSPLRALLPAQQQSETLASLATLAGCHNSPGAARSPSTLLAMSPMRPGRHVLLWVDMT